MSNVIGTIHEDMAGYGNGLGFQLINEEAKNKKKDNPNKETIDSKSTGTAENPTV